MWRRLRPRPILRDAFLRCANKGSSGGGAASPRYCYYYPSWLCSGILPSGPPAGALGFAQRIVAVGALGEAAGMHHAVQAHDQGPALHVELRLVEVIDDLLHRQADRIFGQNLENEVLDVVAAAGGDEQRLLP